MLADSGFEGLNLEKIFNLVVVLVSLRKVLNFKKAIVVVALSERIQHSES